MVIIIIIIIMIVVVDNEFIGYVDVIINIDRMC